ncbi:MAG: PEP-CTERM sorting domain-containing protein [Pirellulaceae bacterium]
MKLPKWYAISAILAVCLMPVAFVQAAVIGQIDTFEDGTTQGLQVGLGGLAGAFHPAPPVNEASGGPLGADDNYLKLTSFGNEGPGGRLVAINIGQWSGDYSSAGITAISMDLRNLGAIDLNMRLFLANPGPGPATDGALTQAVSLPSGGGWTRGVFQVDSLSLIPLAGNMDTLLANVTELRLLHGPTAEFPPAVVVAQLGVDNITAVPEPCSLSLLGLGLIGLLAWKIRHAGAFTWARPGRGVRL